MDLTGQVFGRLAVLGKADRPGRVWLCQCRGSEQTPHNQKTVRVSEYHLLNGETRSCGCLRRELAVEQMREVGRARGSVAAHRKGRNQA